MHFVSGNVGSITYYTKINITCARTRRLDNKVDICHGFCTLNDLFLIMIHLLIDVSFGLHPQFEIRIRNIHPVFLIDCSNAMQFVHIDLFDANGTCSNVYLIG